MANGNNSSEVYDSSSSCLMANDDDRDEIYNEPFNSLIKAKKESKLANNKIEMLNEET